MSDISFAEHSARDARLCILRELHRQVDGRLNEVILAQVLSAWGHNRSREWVRTQIRKMEELGAIVVTMLGEYLVAEITRAGTDHIERRSIIEGIARPSPSA